MTRISLYFSGYIADLCKNWINILYILVNETGLLNIYISQSQSKHTHSEADKQKQTHR